jgi:molybdopterin molybdotransferase
VAKQADLLSVDDARSRILSRFSRLAEELVSLRESRGRVLARAVAALIDLPPFANSSMDGFALRSESTTAAAAGQSVRLIVTGTIPAGSFSDRPIEPGQCMRIMTGAPLPMGADAVVPFEDVEDHGNAILLSAPIPAGACVRPAGQDTRSGSTILDAGTEIGTTQLALLAAQGIVTVPVVRQPRVAVLTTGDELVAPGSELRPGQIYNSNGPMLEAAILEAGGIPIMAPAVADDPDAMTAAVNWVKGADLLLTSGGASVGDFDHVKDVVGGAGELSFWRVRVRPGKPLLFGSIAGMPVIGLPGNPTSAMVTFEQFVRPSMRTMLGLPPLRPEIDAVLDERIDNRGGRRTYARVRLRTEDGRFHATLAGPQDSAMLVPLARADGLLEVPEDREELLPGDIGRVQVWRLPK